MTDFDTDESVVPVPTVEAGDRVRLNQDTPDGAFRNETGVVVDVDPVTAEVDVVFDRHMFRATVPHDHVKRYRTAEEVKEERRIRGIQ
jgi:transcription antitermination factor NusG